MEPDNNFLNFKYNNVEPLQGTSLVSMPLLNDSYFARSVVYLTENNEKGSFGFILNKPSKHKLHELMSDFPVSDFPVFIGGPVGSDTIHFIHTAGDQIADAIPVSSNIFWGGSLDSVRELIKKNMLKPKDIRFFLGYSGWSPNQLNEELQKDSWLVQTLKAPSIFSTDQEDIWEEALASLGGKYKAWVNIPSNPILN